MPPAEQPTEIPAAESGTTGNAAVSLSYTLDLDNAITSVAGNWDRFALDNGGHEILSARVVGRRIEQFISGDITLMFVRTMLMSARTLNRRIRQPYRCDSPQLKRFMEMTIVPQGQGMLEVCHRQLRSEPYRCALPMLTAASSGAYFVKRCSICNRVRLRRVWGEVDDADGECELLQRATAGITVIYGVCPDCMAHRCIAA